MAPEITESTKEEREAYIQNLYNCIADCDSCGICQVFHGKEPMIAFEDYIMGKRSYQDICMDYR